MMELKRLLYNKKGILIILFLAVLQFITLFYGYYNQEPVDDAMPDTQSEKQVQDILDECDRYLGISLFADVDSFAYKNVQKTKNDYSKILSVETADIDTSFLDFFISYETMNYILLGIGMILVFTYMEPGSQGLKAVTNTAKNGRGIRRLKQIFVLIGWSGMIVLILCGGSLLLWLLLTRADGLKVLGFPIQTISSCRLFPVRLSILEYLIGFIFFKWMVMFEFVLIIWFIFLIIENTILAFGTVTILFLAEYVICRLIGMNSSYNILRYCNLWYHLSSNEYLYTYLNLNIGNHPINRHWVILAVILILTAILTMFSYLKGEYSKIGTSKFEIPFFFSLRKCMQKKLNLLTAELYKLLIMQKGFLLLLVFTVFIMNQSDFTNVSNTGYQDMYYSFMDQYKGVPSKESEHYIKTLSKEVNEVTKEYERAEDMYSRGSISADDYLTALIKYDAFYNERKFLSIIEQQQGYLQRLQREKGIKGWYVNTYCYQSILESVLSLKYGLLIVFMILMAFASIKVENDADIFRVLNCTLLGRKCLLHKKLIAVNLVTFIMYIILLTVKFSSALHVYGISALGAPVQSLERYYRLPFSISLLQWIILYYGMILLMIVFASTGVTLLFQRFRHDA